MFALAHLAVDCAYWRAILFRAAIRVERGVGQTEVGARRVVVSGDPGVAQSVPQPCPVYMVSEESSLSSFGTSLQVQGLLPHVGQKGWAPGVSRPAAGCFRGGPENWVLSGAFVVPVAP